MKAAVLRNTSRALIISMSLACLPLAQANAALLGTETTLAGAAVTLTGERAQVRDFLMRDDVVSLLQARGVDHTAALARVDAMTDGEIATLAERLDQLPAGGTSVVGVLFAVFVILLVTDILGFTKVFPFTRSVR